LSPGNLAPDRVSKYVHDPDGLIAARYVIAMEFATIAAAQRRALRVLVKIDSTLLASRASVSLLMVYDRRSALSRALYAGAQVLFCSAMTLGSCQSCAMLWRIPVDTHEQRIGIMSTLFSVILSAAKDLMPVASGDEILRCAPARRLLRAR
jgi:hypothetical protein